MIGQKCGWDLINPSFPGGSVKRTSSQCHTTRLPRTVAFAGIQMYSASTTQALAECEPLKQNNLAGLRCEHQCRLHFAGIYGYFSLAQSHISMQTEGREAEERPGVWCSAALGEIWRQTEELAVNKRKYYQCGQQESSVFDTSLRERKLLKYKRSIVRKEGGRSL